MSRAYRISVRERASHILRAGDCVSTQLELLEILPAGRMAELLTDELQKRGFVKEGDRLVRRDDDVVIEVDAATATVTVKIEGEQQVELEGEMHGWADQDEGSAGDARARSRLRRELLKDLERRAEQKTAELQKELTDRLEGHLTDVRRELDQAVNRVTAEALKEKAAQLGQIKEMTEDPESGSLTIVVEV